MSEYTFEKPESLEEVTDYIVGHLDSYMIDRLHSIWDAEEKEENTWELPMHVRMLEAVACMSAVADARAICLIFYELCRALITPGTK